MAIKAIETRYAGCRFRSRLEARWAVFFDHVGIHWQYEPQGFDLPSGPYLPDFWLEESEVWVEIKGHRPTKTEITKMLELGFAASQKGHRCRLLQGDIPRKGYPTCLIPVPEWLPVCGADGWVVDVKDGMPQWRIEDYARVPTDYWHLMPSFWVPGYSMEDIDKALTAARSARFEHGERG